MARSCSGWSTSNYFARSDTGITNEPFTMACWFKTANVAVAGRALMVLSDNVGTGYYMLQLNASGIPQAAKQNPAATTGASASGVTLTANVWTFAAGLFASDTSRTGYSEGTLGTANTTSLTDPTVRRQLIGVRERSSGFDLAFDGNIALPTIWDVVLSEGELDAMSAGMHPARIRPKNIVRAWWMPTAGSRLVDFSAGQKTLTLTGTVTDDAFGPPVEPYIYGLGWPVGPLNAAFGADVSNTVTRMLLRSIVPTISAGKTQSVPVESIRLSAPTPSISVVGGSTDVNAPVASLTLSSRAPTVGGRMQAPPTASIRLSTPVPTLQASIAGLIKKYDTTGGDGVSTTRSVTDIPLTDTVGSETASRGYRNAHS